MPLSLIKSLTFIKSHIFITKVRGRKSSAQLIVNIVSILFFRRDYASIILRILKESRVPFMVVEYM